MLKRVHADFPKGLRRFESVLKRFLHDSARLGHGMGIALQRFETVLRRFETLLKGFETV